MRRLFGSLVQQLIEGMDILVRHRSERHLDVFFQK